MSGGFDSLMWGGFGNNTSDAKVTKRCNACMEDRLVNASDTLCPHCNTTLTSLNSSQGESKVENSEPVMPGMNGMMIQSMMMQLLSGQGGGMNALFGNGFGELGENIGNSTSNMAEMWAAQQGVDIQAMMQNMLSESQKNTATSKDYLRLLKPRSLNDVDFVQVRLTLEGMSGPELVPTCAKFGASLIQTHVNLSEASEDHRHLQTTIQPASTHVELLSPSETATDATLLVKRGGITFADKAKRAQAMGAACLVVIQSGDVWPYVMTDSTNSSGDVTIPVLMVSAKDGSKMMERLQSQGDGEKKLGGARLTVRTVTQNLECCVCREDFERKEEAVNLPCTHYYHLECIMPWLEKHNTCPLCRHELPAEEEQHTENRQEAINDMMSHTFA